MIRMFLLWAAMAAGIGPGMALGQTAVEIGQALDQVDRNRREVVVANLPLSEQEAAGFWQIYDRYRAEVRDLEEEAIRLGIEFASDYDSLADKRARELVEAVLDLRARQVALKQRYLGEFEKQVGARKVFRFYQIENRMDTLSQYEGQELIPLLE